MPEIAREQAQGVQPPEGGILSYTSLSVDGKVYFFRQEIAAMLEANTVIGKNSLMKKLGISGWLTGITSFFRFLADCKKLF